MNITPLGLAGARLITSPRLQDERGHFLRIWTREDFAAAGIDQTWHQNLLAFNPHKGTIRGLHYQLAPHSEAKLIRCARGAIFDVAVDLRPASPTYLGQICLELDEAVDCMLYLPAGCAHGYQTLRDDAEVHYLIGADYVPTAGAGVRWNDPRFAIKWPLPVSLIAARDASYPDYQPETQSCPDDLT